MKLALVLLGLFWVGTLTFAQDSIFLSGERSPFGIVEGFWFPELTCDLQVGWERIIFDWSEHQPNGPEDWHTLNVDDRWLKAAALCNRQVVALLKNTPQWATDQSAGPGVPRGLYLAVDDPQNVWASFVRRSAAYYSSRGVNHFILWNEPDIDPETYGHEFSGDLEDYFQMLKIGYLAARQGNPAAVIHLAGTTYWHDVNRGAQPYFERLIERILADEDAEANGHYFDVLSLHIYFRTQTVSEIVLAARAMLDAHGLSDKAIWIKETNAAPTDDPVWPVVRPQFPLNLEQQAAFLIQAASLGVFAGAEQIAAYKLYDQALAPGAESFGLLSPPDASPRPAYYAWQVVARYFYDQTGVSRVQSRNIDLVRLSHESGRQTLVIWSQIAEDVQVVVASSASKLYKVDYQGRISILRAERGRYTLTLPAARCDVSEGCFIGGSPVLLMLPPGTFQVYELSNGEERELVSF